MGLYRYLSFFYLSGALACYLSLMAYLFKSITFENAHPQSQRVTNNQQPTTNNQQPTTNNQPNAPTAKPLGTPTTNNRETRQIERFT